MDATNSTYGNLAEYCEATGKRKNFVALRELGVTPQQFTALLYPEIYRPKVTVDLAVTIATLLNQPVENVVALYSRRAA